MIAIDMKFIELFNNRDENIVEQFYTLFSRELNFYSASLYGAISMESEDLVENVMIALWFNKKKFNSTIAIKSYLYVSVKNGFLRQLERNNNLSKIHNEQAINHNFMVDIMETEITSYINESIKVLPEHYAKVIKLFLEGWNFEEIANEMGETNQRIYTIKSEAIKILKKNKKDLFLIISALTH